MQKVSLVSSDSKRECDVEVVLVLIVTVLSLLICYYPADFVKMSSSIPVNSCLSTV